MENALFYQIYVGALVNFILC